MLCHILWPKKTSNIALYGKTKCHSIITEIKQRCMRWLGHVLRMSQERIPKVTLRLTPPGKEGNEAAQNPRGNVL